MRILAFILSIFVLAMAIMPCDDEFDNAMSPDVSKTQVENHSDNHSHQNEDGCTPFCICQCCGTPIILPALFNFNEKNEVALSSISFHYSSLYFYDYSNGVWHPPTIG